MAGYQFIFGGETGETPESIKRKREIAEALMAYNQPKNAGEGIGAVARGLAAGITNMRANRAEKAGKSAATEALAKLFGGGAASATAPGSTPGNIPMTSAANEVSAGAPNPAQPMFANDGTELGGYLSDPSRRSKLPAGMRNNNPGNIKYVGQKVPGIVGPSENTDQGDPQAVFATPEAGMAAMYSLAKRKYDGGKKSANQLIAGNMGWTPGNFDAAANVARTMGISPDDDINLNDPKMASSFMKALILQEHGKSGNLYPEAMIQSVVGGAPTQVASAAPQTATDAIQQASPLPSPPAPQAYADTQVVNVGPKPPVQIPMPDQAPMALSPPAPQQQPQQQASLPPLPSSDISAAPAVAAIPQQEPAPSPAPPQTAPSQQVAQALMPPPAETGPTLEQLIQASQQPFLSDGQQRVLNALIQQKGAERSAIREMQIKQADPAYQAELAKTKIELQNLQNPRIAPADQARIDLEKQKQATDQQTNKEKMAFEREKFDAEVQKGQWQKLTDGRLYNQTTGEFKDAPPPLPGSAPVKLDDISGMRKEIQQLPSYKNLAQAAPIYKSMAETAGRNSRASDLNLVYGLGKIMDPTSVVREGEMVMVKNTASLPDWLIGAANSLNGGAALTPETRQAIMTEAYGRMKGYNDEFQQNMGQYHGIVQRNGINPADVIPEIDKFDPWTPPEPPPENPLPPTPGTNKTSTGIPWKVIK